MPTKKVVKYDFKTKSEAIVLELTKLAKHFEKNGSGANLLTPGSSVSLENIALLAARVHDAMTGAKVERRSKKDGQDVGASGRAERGLREGLGYTYP